MKYEIQSINKEITSITMFEECGRPDIMGTNTVIGSHSGTSIYAHFNNIEYLEKNDEVKIIYNNMEYIYIVVEVKEVLDTEISILNDTGISNLTLLTCKKEDYTKRIAVICNLVV